MANHARRARGSAATEGRQLLSSTRMNGARRRRISTYRMQAVTQSRQHPARRANVVRALIVDDEQSGRLLLQHLLGALHDVVVIDEAASLPEAREKIAALRPDLVFMDIEMPGGSGIEVLEGLEGVQPAPLVIFVTAHAEFALPAFERSAFDYLLKPVQRQRLIRSVLRARKRIADSRLAGVALQIARAAEDREAEDAGGLPARPRYAGQIMVRVRRRIFWLDVADIAWIQGASQYCRVHAASGEFLLSRSLASLEEELDPGRFFRIHRSAIVNAAHVREIRGSGDGGHMLFLQGGEAVPMGRARREVRKRLIESMNKRGQSPFSQSGKR
jgi:two-component system LytT family response regulator